MRYDYGIKERGLSFEHYNFFDSLDHLGVNISYFDFMTEMQDHGKKEMNRSLLQKVKEEAPDLMFTVLFKDEIEKSTLNSITRGTETTTVNWFCDDHWRFDNYSRYYAPCFDHVVTTAQSALPKYREMGFKNVIKSQWACNHFLYQRMDLPLEHDMTFIGQPHSDRRQVIAAIRAAGIPAQTWGNGWEGGRVDQADMIRLFNQSRINLNLSNSSLPITGSTSPLQKYGWKAGKILRRLPGGSAAISSVKMAVDMVGKGTGSPKQISPRSGGTIYREQIKGRNFEVPGCGGFVLTSGVQELDNYFQVGKEVVCYEDTADLIEKAKYFLRNEEERRAIADAGYKRTLAEHTYLHRFKEIFQEVGLSHLSHNLLFDSADQASEIDTHQLT